MSACCWRQPERDWGTVRSVSHWRSGPLARRCRTKCSAAPSRRKSCSASAGPRRTPSHQRSDGRLRRSLRSYQPLGEAAVGVVGLHHPVTGSDKVRHREPLANLQGVIRTRPRCVCPLPAPGGSDGPDRLDRPWFPDGADKRLVVAIDACPIHACTVTGSTPRASQRQAAVCRRSWMRRPYAMEAHAGGRLNAEACSR